MAHNPDPAKGRSPSPTTVHKGALVLPQYCYCHRTAMRYHDTAAPPQSCRRGGTLARTARAPRPPLPALHAGQPASPLVLCGLWSSSAAKLKNGNSTASRQARGSAPAPLHTPHGAASRAPPSTRLQCARSDRQATVSQTDGAY